MLKSGTEYCFSAVSITTAINLCGDHKNKGKYERSATTDTPEFGGKISQK